MTQARIDAAFNTNLLQQAAFYGQNDITALLEVNWDGSQHASTGSSGRLHWCANGSCIPHDLLIPPVC